MSEGSHAPEAHFVLRRADPDDVDTICAIFDHLFGDGILAEHFANFHGLNTGALRSPAAQQRFFLSLIETCFMSVTFEDQVGNIAGFAALDDSPIQMMNTVGAGTDWEDWFQKTFQDPSIDNKNALWFSCLLVEQDTNAMAEMLRTTFSTMLELDHLLLFVPSNTSEEEVTTLLQPFETHFQQLELASRYSPPAGHWAANSVDGSRATVLICSRSDIITPMNIRMAKVEDHDNLAAVFDAQSEVVTEIYGEYFIAELVEAQNEENKALVAEVDGRAVGLLCLTSDVDINVLAQCFELDPYDNLLKSPVMGRVRQHAEAIWSGAVDASLASVGDFLQVALASIDVDALMEPLPRMDDGQINAAYLHGAFAQQEFASEVGETVPDFGKAVMTLLWQARFTEPMLEMGSAVDPQQVGECLQMFRELDFKTRQEVADRILGTWEEVQSIFEATRELLQQQAEQAREEAQQAAAAEGQESPRQPLQEGEEGEEKKVDAIPVQVFLKALLEEQEGPFSQDFLAKMIMCLHWWANLDLGSPVKTVSEDSLGDAVNALKDSEEGLFVNSPNSPAWLANMPQHTKDVFCINMCCLDQAYMTQAIDFLLPAFALYPHKDYCIVTQPHTAPNTPLLNAFTIVPPQPQNTFGHVLYLIHRASLLGPPGIRYLEASDVSAVEPLVENFHEDAQEEIAEGIEQFLASPPEGRLKHVFVAEFDEQIVGMIMLRVPEEDAIDTLRCCYHLDDYLLLEHHDNHDRKGTAQLLHYTINPLFQKYTRRLHQGAMRVCGKTVLFMEVDLNGTVSPIFRELLQVAPRRPPQLKKVLRKPPKVASFANVEKEVPTEEDLREKARQKLLKDDKQTKALSVVSKKLLSETKIPVNARIVVVGASDCGLSFLESLLSIPHLVFNSLILLAPGGLEYHHAHHLPLVAGTAAYSHHELRRIMLELRVRILDSRMVQIDRQQRCCILHDGAMLPYDYLVVAAGLQDDALHALRIRSCGVEHVTDGYRHVNGAMSVADPSIRDLLVEGGTLIKSLIWNPLSCAVVYGRSLHAYCVLQGLLMRKVPPTKIILVLPPGSDQQTPGQHNFRPGGPVQMKIHAILEAMKIKVYDGYRLLGIHQDIRERLKTLVLEEGGEGATGERRGIAASEDGSQHSARAPADAGVDEGDNAASSPRIKCGILEDNGVSPNGLPQKLLACRVIITADSVNVDPDIFNSVHGNGLVYDGRLIVDHNFKTTDDAIFGAGSLCEFSRRFQRKNAERYLRHDGFNGREVGAKLAQVLLRRLDPVNGDMAAAGAVMGTKGANADMNNITQDNAFQSMDPEESSPELLPEFYMPLAKGGFLPGNLHYYRIASCRKGEVQDEQGDSKADRVICTDTLDPFTGKGHFCRLTSDNFGKVDSITYLGGEELQVESLWSLVGLSETFLNHLFVRWRDGDIPDIVEFLTDDWATALFHDRFMDFCQQIKSEMAEQEDIKDIINGKLKGLNLKEGLSRELLAQICEQLPKESVQLMQDHLLEYLRENTNHLKTYFLPENWRHDHYQPPR